MHYSRIIWTVLSFLVLTDTAAQATVQQLPKIKAGLWQTTIMGSDGAEKTTKVFSTQCIDSAVLSLIFSVRNQALTEGCTKVASQLLGNKLVESTECKFKDSLMKSTNETTFESDASLITKNTTKFSAQLDAGQDIEMTTQMKRIGECRPGMRLGDSISGPPNSLITINILDVAKSTNEKK